MSPAKAIPGKPIVLQETTGLLVHGPCRQDGGRSGSQPVSRRMSSPFNTINRAEEYRVRAEEARARAQAMENGKARDALLQAAETWDLMARYEEKEKERPSS